MSDLPSNIWLINVGFEVTWCDSPCPSDDIEEEDVTGYTRDDMVEALIQAERVTIQQLTDENRELRDGYNQGLADAVKQVEKWMIHPHPSYEKKDYNDYHNSLETDQRLSLLAKDIQALAKQGDSDGI